MALYTAFRDGEESSTERLQMLLLELITQMAALPAPWAVRIALAARGLDTGPLPLPLSPSRRAQVAEFRQWFSNWLDESRIPNLHRVAVP